MPTISAGTTATITLAANQIVSFAPDPGETATYVVTRGGATVGGDRVSGPRSVGPLEDGDSMSITADRGAVDYELSNYSDDTLSTQELLALRLVAGDEVEAPPTNLAAAVGSAGALTGAYYYTLTFVTAFGESAPWPGTATVVNPSSQRVNLSAIPLGAAGTIARRIYRTVAGGTDPKDYFFVAEISDNSTTTYTDNTADGSLGAAANWSASNRGLLSDGLTTVARFSDQSTALGQGTFSTNTGYASTAVGFEALKANTSGRRNTAVGVYALTAVTTGYENTAIGVHSGDSLTTGIGNTMLGYDAGSNSITKNFNVAVGNQALNGTGETGNGNVAVGYRALGSINTADQCLGVGYFAGRYANASRQLFIDNSDRTNISNAQNIGLIYGKGEATAIAQVLHLNALVRIGPPSVTVATLPAAAGLAGFRAFVTDANATTFASIVAGGGANGVPVYCDGTNWRIG